MLRLTILHIFFYNLKSKDHQQNIESGLLYIGIEKNFKSYHIFKAFDQGYKWFGNLQTKNEEILLK